MKQTEISIPTSMVKPLSINGLNGRVLRRRSIKQKHASREILAIYGHHSSLERMYAIVENLAEYGNVTLPDIPGFGGMDAFYVIHKTPTLDNYADYLATFIKLKYKKRKFTIVAMSFGFVAVTKMLQKYPELAKQVDILVSLVGFTTKQDFKLSIRKQKLIRYTSAFCSNELSAMFVRYMILNQYGITLMYNAVAKRHAKMKDADKAELKRRIKFEIYLWQCNDVRTYMYTTNTMLNLSINKVKVEHNVIHVATEHDQYFKNSSVKKNLSKVYSKVTVIESALVNHAPTVISNPSDASGYIPKKLRRILDRKLK